MICDCKWLWKNDGWLWMIMKGDRHDDHDDSGLCIVILSTSTCYRLYWWPLMWLEIHPWKCGKSNHSLTNISFLLLWTLKSQLAAKLVCVKHDEQKTTPPTISWSLLTKVNHFYGIYGSISKKTPNDIQYPLPLPKSHRFSTKHQSLVGNDLHTWHGGQ